MRSGVSFGHVVPFRAPSDFNRASKTEYCSSRLPSFLEPPRPCAAASVFSGQLGILPLSQPSVAHLPPPATPLAAALPPHPASGSRNTCQGRGHVAAPGDQLPNTPPGKKVELHRPDRRQRSGSSTTASSERRRRGRTHRQ